MRSFVVADIPGLISGASEGQGLGVRFLKHLTRNRVLLHLVDVAPADQSNPVENAVSIVNELEQFSEGLYQRERWLVLTKTDLLDAESLEALQAELCEALDWQGPTYCVSAVTGDGIDGLVHAVMSHLEVLAERYEDDPDALQAELDLQTRMQQEARAHIEKLAEARRNKRKAKPDDDEDEDFDVEVIYVDE